ncbi:MAG: hypothetical protein SVX43_14955 [Cyanobacteriota bacterium]|nr:hypothetical protein [Cyanobacteriota bacterium]
MFDKFVENKFSETLASGTVVFGTLMAVGLAALERRFLILKLQEYPNPNLNPNPSPNPLLYSDWLPLAVWEWP